MPFDIPMSVATGVIVRSVSSLYSVPSRSAPLEESLGIVPQKTRPFTSAKTSLNLFSSSPGSPSTR